MKQFFSPNNPFFKLILAGLIIILLFLIKIQVSQWQKKQTVSNEIAKLTAQQQEMEQKNTDLSQSLAYLSSENYKEKVAREQLNFKKDGEIVVRFTDPIIVNQSSNEHKTDDSSNLKDWLYYFFKH